MIRKLSGIGLATCTLCLAFTACSSSDSAPEPSGPAVTDPASFLAAACSDTPESIDQMPTGLSAFDASKRGELVRCAPVATYTAQQLHDAAKTLGYAGAMFPSGAKAYRIVYRTQRNTPSTGPAPEGLSSALVLLPDHPKGGTSPTPMVVVAHGSVGIADICAPSRGSLITPGNYLDDFRSVALPIAGAGWMVIAPDYAGFGYGSTPGWLLAEDEAYSLLDSTRAMTKLLKPGVMNGKVAMVGHSQGGHAVLSAQSYAASYGMEGTLVGVAAFAPMWFVTKAFMAALAAYNPVTNPSFVAYSLEYFYTHGELYDGPGKGVEVLKPEKQEAARTLLTTQCLSGVSDHIADLGAANEDFFDPDFLKNVTTCALGGSCTAPPADKWDPRFKKDRPALDPQGAPILIWQGALDHTVTAGYAKCGFDKIRADLGASADKLKVCGDPTAIHGGFIGDEVNLSDGITRRGMDWVNEWISARTLGTPEPAACAGEEALAGSGGTLVCATPPKNVD
ncbi:MAG: alpha/beta fold hydrolase [Deltaproteobacteria bacterium]|nr:alpha/beta fold hydrolase [Deltaproteobacteria bacterium]